MEIVRRSTSQHLSYAFAQLFRSSMTAIKVAADTIKEEFERKKMLETAAEKKAMERA